MDQDTVERLRRVVYSFRPQTDCHLLRERPLGTVALVYLGWEFRGQVLNGGLPQFFFNGSGEHTLETVEALRQLGFVEESRLLAEYAELLFQGKPVPANIDERNDAMCDAQLTDQAETRLKAIQDEMRKKFGYGEALMAGLASCLSEGKDG